MKWIVSASKSTRKPHFPAFLMRLLQALIWHRFQHACQVLCISPQLSCHICRLEYTLDFPDLQNTHMVFHSIYYSLNRQSVFSLFLYLVCVCGGGVTLRKNKQNENTKATFNVIFIVIQLLNKTYTDIYNMQENRRLHFTYY